ncbi:MAG TPA: hypothetical protein DCR55_08305 [Lentisphaeria bacterium]|nr:hypothetical protein [Lentisphaeria bacterium]
MSIRCQLGASRCSCRRVLNLPLGSSHLT